jgi:hypothetical protein
LCLTALTFAPRGATGADAAGLSRARAIVGGTLIDGTGAGPLADAAVVILNGKIACAGRGSTSATCAGFASSCEEAS